MAEPARLVSYFGESYLLDDAKLIFVCTKMSMYLALLLANDNLLQYREILA